MRKQWMIAICTLAFASVAMSETKFETKWHCGKFPQQHVLEIGDVAGHSYGLAQGTCTATASSTGEKTGTATEIQEMWNTSFVTHGHFVVTMAGGEKVYHDYQATGDPVKKTSAEKWKIVGGTGKFKGDTGSGTCAGTLHDDGSSDWVCSGTSSKRK
jgi:hypothetical protein